MIEFTRSELTHFVIHYTGNKGLGEELTTTEKDIEIADSFVKETVVRYFTAPFKTDLYYQFKSKNEFHYHDVKSYCTDVFSSRKNFVEASKKIAEHLYNQSMHPKIKGGEFYMCYFKDCIVDGELTDAIGIFKTENKGTYLKVFQNADEFEVDADNGININKLDKGCLIFNTEKERGYKISVVDSNNKIAECASYWTEDFLNAEIKENAYYHTSNFIETCVGFCEEILTEENNVQKLDQSQLLQESVGYLVGRDKINVDEFNKEILVSPELINAFKDYKKERSEKLSMTEVEDFEVSETALKKNKKYMRTITKLDKNFHIYIHGRHDYIERGYDEEKGLKFYKLFYINEE